MAVLARSSKYGLSQSKSSDKTLCYVKLTDAALKTIEEFSRQRARYGGEKDAQIQFSENEGIIRIPSLQGDSSRGGSSDTQWFKFTVASTASVDGTHCSNDCVQQVKQQSLRSLGPLLYRIRVQAKDDVYETARQRMTSVREESEKNCAKMIKTCPAVGGRNIKVKSGNIRPHPTVPTSSTTSSTTSSSTSNTTSSTTSNSSSTTTTNQSRPTTSKDGRRPGFTGRGPGPGPGPAGGPPHGGSDAQKFPSPSGPTRGGFGQSSSVLPSVSSLPNAQRASGGLVNQRHSSPASGTSRRGAVSDVMKRPLRERIVHLLAVRSYKKPELVDRLRRDGLREKDNVTAALVGIAYMKDNTYHLAKHAWSEVNEDWPFYTLQDKQTIKWRKPETLTPPSDSSSSSGHSPGPNSGSTSPPGPGNSANYKRPGYYNEHPDAPPKKVRISHYKRPQAGPDESRIILPPGNPNQGPGSSLISGSGISFGSRGSLNTLPNNHNSRQATNGGGGGAAGGGGNAVSQPGWNSGRNLSMMTESARDELARRTKSTAPSSSTAGRDYNAGEAPNEWRNRGGSNRYESAPSSMTSSTNSQPTPESSPDARRHEEPEPPPKKPPPAVTDFSPDEYPKDYVKDFVRIETWDQRNRYKAIFNTEYEEYRKLYSKFNGIAQEFSNLESKLKKCEAGTEARAGARQRILDSYESHKKAEFVEKRRRLSYLHAKLAHIKQLVLDFHVRNPPGGRTVE